jgi:Spy/CpxP family protein refolding chaperone
MRASFKTTLAASLAAVTLFASVAGASAYYPWPHHHHWHHGFGWGPGIAFGVIGAGMAAEACLRSTPVYDAWGNYVGERTVNVCY